MTKPIVTIPNGIRLEVLKWKNPPETLTTVPTSPEAAAVFAAFTDEIYAKMMQADKTGDETNYLYGKALENARRVALILATGRHGGREAIGERDAVYACTLVKYLIGDVIRAVRETVAESPDEKAKKRILQVVAQAGRGGIAKQDLTRKTQFLRKQFRDEYLDDLVESEELRMGTNSKGGVMYYPEL